MFVHMQFAMQFFLNKYNGYTGYTASNFAVRKFKTIFPEEIRYVEQLSTLYVLNPVQKSRKKIVILYSYHS